MASSLGLRNKSGYGAVLGAPGFLPWALGSVPYRAARAMAPLALVLLGHERAGNFGTGAVLVGALTIAEVLLAPVVVARIRPSWGLLGYAACLAALLGLPLDRGWAVGCGVLLTALGGGCAAGMAGRSRATLLAVAPPGATTRALSLDSSLSAALYAVGPAIVATTAAAAVVLPVALVAGLGGASALAVARHPHLWGGWSVRGDSGAERARPEPRPATRVVRDAWPTLLAGAAFMGATSVLDVVLPARLADVGRVADAGYLLGVFAGVGLLSGLLYGAVADRLPGTDVQRSVASTLLMCLLLVPVAWASSSVLVGLLVLAGALGPPGLIARAAHLQSQVPGPSLPTAYALLSSCYGLGTGLAVVAAGPAVDLAGPGTTLLGVLALAAVLTVVGTRRTAQ